MPAAGVHIRIYRTSMFTERRYVMSVGSVDGRDVADMVATCFVTGMRWMR